MLQVCLQGGPNLTPEEIRRMFDHLKRHFRAMNLARYPVRAEASCVSTSRGVRPLAWQPSGVRCVPGRELRWRTSPATCHRRRFHWRLLAEFRIAHGPGNNHERVTAQTEAIAHLFEKNTHTCSSVQSYTRLLTCGHTRTRTTDPPQEQQQQYHHNYATTAIKPH